MCDSAVCIQLSQCIRRYLSQSALIRLVDRVITNTTDIDPNICSLDYYVSLCIYRICHKVSQYIRRYQGILAIPPDENFGTGAVAETCRTIQRCVTSPVDSFMSTLITPMYAEDKDIKTNLNVERILDEILRSMLNVLLQQKVAAFNIKNNGSVQTNNEYVWTAIGKLATIIDMYNRQPHEPA